MSNIQEIKQQLAEITQQIHLVVRHGDPAELHVTPSSPGDAQLLLCPTCRSGYVRVLDAEIIPGKDAYAATKVVRGDVLAVPAKCEMGHAFTVCLGFHKGKTQVWTVKQFEDYGHHAITR